MIALQVERVAGRVELTFGYHMPFQPQGVFILQIENWMARSLLYISIFIGSIYISHWQITMLRL